MFHTTTTNTTTTTTTTTTITITTTTTIIIIIIIDDELHTSFYGSDPIIIREALELLERDKKCVILKGDTDDDDGVKFIE